MSFIAVISPFIKIMGVGQKANFWLNEKKQELDSGQHQGQSYEVGILFLDFYDYNLTTMIAYWLVICLVAK